MFVLLLAKATAEATVVALLHIGRGPANVVPRFISGRTPYCPGPGVYYAPPTVCRVSSRLRFRTPRKPGDVARASHECTGPRRSEVDILPENKWNGGAQSSVCPTCIGPVSGARSPQAWSPCLVLTPLALSAFYYRALCCGV